MKIICVGRNYSSHVKELHNALPEHPVLFMKPDTALLRNRNVFFLPSFSNDVHYEAELVLKISRIGKNISEKFAPAYYDEITLGIDFTARDLQQQQKTDGLPWEIAKAFDNSAVAGEFISKNDCGNLKSIVFSLQVNGVLKQQGNSADMLSSFDKVIAYASSYFTLKKGDLIFTGTPAGVGSVKTGDRLEGFIGERKLMECLVR